MQNEQAKREIQEELETMCDLITVDFLAVAKGKPAEGELEIPRRQALIELAAQVAARLFLEDDVEDPMELIHCRFVEILNEKVDTYEARRHAH
jgi:hypothetical protein